MYTRTDALSGKNAPTMSFPKTSAVVSFLVGASSRQVLNMEHTGNFYYKFLYSYWPRSRWTFVSHLLLLTYWLFRTRKLARANLDLRQPLEICPAIRSEAGPPVIPRNTRPTLECQNCILVLHYSSFATRVYELVALGPPEHSIDYRYLTEDRPCLLQSQRMYLEVSSLVEVRDCSPTGLSCSRSAKKQSEIYEFDSFRLST